MSVRSLTLTHDRLKRNSIVIIGAAIVFGNTANSVGCKITKEPPLDAAVVGQFRFPQG
ncbi:MAG: hypothetical protein WCA20_37955 [Candidatus Sulfotelmatobacter sp.]